MTHYQQRIMKYRAWDMRQKKFLIPWPEGFHLLGETTCFDLIGQQLAESKDEGQTQFDRLKDVIITEYTGLRDKHGKEIYEGDVIGHIAKGVVEFDKYIGFRIRWDTKTAQVRREKCLDGMPGNLDTVGSPWEILGNIYESPELVNDKK